MITLDPESGYDSPEERSIVYTDPLNEKLYDLTITSFVVLQTIRYLDMADLDYTDYAVVSEHTSAIAEYLVGEGWFSADEYIRSLARAESEDVDAELKDLLG